MKALTRNRGSHLLYLILILSMAGAVGLLPSRADQRVRVANRDDQPVRVAIYSGQGAYFRSIKAATRMFIWMGAEPQRITPQEIIDGKLTSFDVLYMTGGWAVPYIQDLQNGGIANIRKFIQQV